MNTNSHLSDILRRADMEMLRGEWEKAEPLYREARALAPGDPQNWYYELNASLKCPSPIYVRQTDLRANYEQSL